VGGSGAEERREIWRKKINEVLGRHPMSTRMLADRMGGINPTHQAIRDWARGTIPNNPDWIRKFARRLKEPVVPLLEAAGHEYTDADIRADSREGDMDEGKRALHERLVNALTQSGGRFDLHPEIDARTGSMGLWVLLYAIKDGLTGAPPGTDILIEPADNATLGDKVVVQNDDSTLSVTDYVEGMTAEIIGIVRAGVTMY